MGLSRWSFRGLQVFSLLALYGGWHYSQYFLETTRGIVVGVSDRTHQILAEANHYLNAHPNLADGILILSSLELDIAALSMVAFFFIRKETRPLLSFWIVLVMRQLCQTAISMPKPDGLIWHYPGFPSLVVTYGASSDFFFSGHMTLATLFAAELTVQRAVRWKQIMAWSMIPVQALVILSMRFHYITDVVAGFLAAIVATLIGRMLGAMLDRRVAARFAPVAV
jgi:hypothetical protein